MSQNLIVASQRQDRQPEAPPDYDPELMGHRFARRRKLFGWTVEELARRTGVSRHTIMRIEDGHRARYSSIRRIRAKLQFFSEQLTRNEQPSPLLALHRAARNRWLVGRNRDRRGREVYRSDFIYVDDFDERKRQAGLDFQPFFTCILKSELPGGVMGQALMEIYVPSPFDRHYGEEFVYCLEGALEMTVGDEIAVLEAGDSIVFDATTPHRYAPAAPTSGKHSPVRILVVVATRPDECEKMKALDAPPRNWGV